MSAPTPIDAEIAAFLAALRADWQAHPPLDTLSAPDARRVAEAVRARWRQGGPRMAEVTEWVAQTEAGPITARLYRPNGLPPGPAPTLIYLHGGGFVFFSLDTHDRLMREYADRGGFAVLGLDYPLSPEARYPLALDRIVAFITSLARDGAERGIDPARIAIGGDSAGANLSLAACLRLRDMDAAQPIRALLSNYGAFARDVSDADERAHGGADAILTQAEMLWYFEQYVAAPTGGAEPYAEPLHAADLTRLPPMLLIVPDRDVLAPQSFALAERLAEARVAAEIAVYPGATHSFLEAMSVSRLACDAIAQAADWIGVRLGSGSGEMSGAS